MTRINTSSPGSKEFGKGDVITGPSSEAIERSNGATIHPCMGRIYGNYNTYNCSRNAKVERAGKWYCGIHDPVARKEKSDKRDAISHEKIAHSNAQSRLRSAAPDLLAALELALTALHEAEAILGGDYGDHYGPFCEQMLELESAARAAIAKALGQ